MINTGDRCIYCGEDTKFGSGRFVNRVPAGSSRDMLDEKSPWYDADSQEEIEGVACAECMAMPCDKCGELIPMDEDVNDAEGRRLHEECAR